MTIKIIGNREINCDGMVGTIRCKSSFSRTGVNEPVNNFVDSAMERGWIYNPSTEKWYCSKCSQTVQK